MSDADTPLPIDTLRADFAQALAAGHMVVTAATGSGKSTRLPVWAREHGRVLVVEPRRLAATSLARFVARTLDTRLGDGVGYAVRLDARHGPDTEVVFVTPGIALRWYGEDRLRGFTTVVLDEFHERRWDTDLLLALLQAGASHRLVVTSATIAGARLAQHLSARHLSSEGRSHPVDIEYRAPQPRAMPETRDLARRVAGAVQSTLQAQSGDCLVFLPGKGEIQACYQALKGIGATVLRLHASAPAADQAAALAAPAPDAPPRVILSTNVAETSLTVPGITAVIDSGLERRTHRRNGRTVLSLQPIARASADQRAGRAGRLQPGRCLRLWGHQAPLAAVTPPEIQREDLSDLVLAAACAGARAEALPFPEPLPAPALEQAVAGLRALGALDPQGRATERGHRLFQLPVDTELAHLAVAMPDTESAGFMADLAAALSTGRRWVQPPADPADEDALARALPRRCDATLLVAALRLDKLPGVRVDRASRKEARRLADQLRGLMNLPARPVALEGDPTAAFAAAVRALPRRTYVRRERRRQAMGNGGDELLISDQSRLDPEAEAALCLDEHSVPGRGTRQTVTLGTCLAPVPLQALLDAGLAEATLQAPRLEEGRLLARRSWRYAGRTLHSEDVVPEGAPAREAMAELILADRLLRPAGARLRDDLAAWALYVALGQGQGTVPSPRPWLVEQLTELGVENQEDLQLIEPEDLAFEGVPEWERARFDEHYPRRIQLPDLLLQVHYDVRRRVITVEKVRGSRKRDPQRWELPAWPGWRIKYQRASRVVEVR
ncbi:helicase-related protein [Alkalilimnicola ehrlichii]|uniref:helicase-related protein n=1 Tax=Alkalilimnicola ehrlichii TaxID=351052 RepID=UPI003B9F216F